jgi:hypothetical protein
MNHHPYNKKEYWIDKIYFGFGAKMTMMREII